MSYHQLNKHDKTKGKNRKIQQNYFAEEVLTS